MKFPPDYVLDKMEMYEIRSVMKYSYYTDMELWESLRLIAYILAQSNSKKKLKIQDIIEFPWEKETETSISKNDILRLQQIANKIKID